MRLALSLCATGRSRPSRITQARSTTERTAADASTPLMYHRLDAPSQTLLLSAGSDAVQTEIAITRTRTFLNATYTTCIFFKCESVAVFSIACFGS